MKSKKKRKIGFTIIELLTVMSIIVVLISLLVPSLNAVRRYSRVVVQRGQFHDIEMGLEMFSIDFDGYPDSIDNSCNAATDPRGTDPYCGAMKLCEAMLGQDGLGFHPDSIFRMDGTDGGVPPEEFYRDPPPPLTDEERRARKNPYIDIVNKYKMCSMVDLYGTGNTEPYDPCSTVISDVFYRIRGQVTGEKLGMPVLYYKADIGKLKHYLDAPYTEVCIDPTAEQNIYDYRDNYFLLGLMVAGQNAAHPLYVGIPIPPPPISGPELFYRNTFSKEIAGFNRPYKEESYILISAGWDGLYGTRDDVYNFAEK